MAHNHRPIYGRSSSDAALNFSITESPQIQNGHGFNNSRSNGSMSAAMRAAYAEASRENGYRLSRSRDEFENGSSRVERHHQHYRGGDFTLPRNTARNQVRNTSRESNFVNEDLWKRKTASLPRSKGKQQRSAFSSPNEMGDGYSRPVYNRQNSAGDSIHSYSHKEDVSLNYDHRNDHHHHSVTRASSFQFQSDFDYHDYRYRANQTVQHSHAGSSSSLSKTLHVESRGTSVHHRNSSPVEDDRFRGYSVGSRGSSPRPNMHHSNSCGNTHKLSSGSDGDQSPNTSFSSSVGSPGKKKLSRKPSFKAFGSLIQKMVRHIGSMDEGKNWQSQDGSSGNSSIANGDAENHPPTSPPCSPILLHGRVPGLSGLRNHGNTCFMNAIVQCLSNTDVLAEYFVLEQYRQDLTHSKKLSKKFGTKGEVTEQLAILLKAIWSCKYSPHHTTEFKRIVARHGSQYRGNDQHDAQEFLIWLLDKVHEDLNSAKKKYKQLKNGQNKSDELMAAESLANHMRRNNSFVQELFQAQYRSSLTCPHCGKQSNTFDPFLCVSLPIPQRTTRVVIVVVIYADRDPRAVRFGVVLETSGTVADLRSTIASTCSIAVTRIVLTEVYFDGFYRSFGDAQPLSDIHDGDSIYAVETPHNSHSMLQNSQVKPFLHVHCNRPTEVITMVIINQQGTGRSGKRFGQPMAIEVDRNVSHDQLTVIILKAMGCSPSNLDRIMQSRKKTVATRLAHVLQLGIVIDAKGSRHYIPAEEARPMHNATITRMLQGTSEEGGPPHVKAIVEWERDIRTMFCQRSMSIYIEEHESVQRERTSHQQPVRASLFDCIDLYTQEEKLGEDNAWHCSYCKRLQQGTKKLTLWSLPEVLILHLKRFKQVGAARTKLSTQVDFPIHNLNMGQYIEHRKMAQGLSTNGNSQAALLNSLTAWSPWKQQGGRRRSSTLIGDNVYDLYAVCNHSGSLTGGHYTAYCKNSLDGQWYHFDDAKVVPVPEERLVNKGAYLLFYHRRAQTAGSTSTDGSMSSSSSDHWVYKLPAYARQCSNTSSGQDSVFSSGGSSYDGSSPMMETPPPGPWGTDSQSPHPAATSHLPHPAPTNHSPHPAATSHSPHFAPTSHSPHPAPTSHSPHPAPTSHSPHPAPTGHSSRGSRTDMQRQDPPEWYNQNGVDMVDSSRAKSSGRLTPGHRSWQGSRDLMEDDESAGFSSHSRPFVRGVAGPVSQRSSSLHRPAWDHCESDNDSVLTESCV